MATRIPVVPGPTVGPAARAPRDVVVSEEARPNDAVANELQRQGVNFRRISEETERLAIFHDENASTEAATRADEEMRAAMNNDYLTLQHDAAIGATAAAEKRYTDIQTRHREGLGTRRAKALFDRKIGQYRKVLKEKLANHEVKERRRWSDKTQNAFEMGLISAAVDLDVGNKKGYSDFRAVGHNQIDNYGVMNSLSPAEVKMRKEAFDNLFWTRILDRARIANPIVAERLYTEYGKHVTDPELRGKLLSNIEQEAAGERAHQLAEEAFAIYPNPGEYDKATKHIRKNASSDRVRKLALEDARSMFHANEQARTARRIEQRVELDDAFVQLVEARADRDTMWNWTRGMKEYGLQKYYWDQWQSLSAKSTTSEKMESKAALTRWHMMPPKVQLELYQEALAQKDPISYFRKLGMRSDDILTATKEVIDLVRGKVTLDRINRDLFRNTVDNMQKPGSVNPWSTWDLDDPNDAFELAMIEAKFNDIIRTRQAMNKMDGKPERVSDEEQVKILTRLISEVSLGTRKTAGYKPDGTEVRTEIAEEEVAMYKILGDPAYLHRIIVPTEDYYNTQQEMIRTNQLVAEEHRVPISDETVKLWYLRKTWPSQFGLLSKQADETTSLAIIRAQSERGG